MHSDRRRQVATTKRIYGKGHYQIIGKKGGLATPTKFTSETAKLAAKKRWEKKEEK